MIRWKRCIKWYGSTTLSLRVRTNVFVAANHIHLRVTRERERGEERERESEREEREREIERESRFVYFVPTTGSTFGGPTSTNRSCLSKYITLQVTAEREREGGERKRASERASMFYFLWCRQQVVSLIDLLVPNALASTNTARKKRAPPTLLCNNCRSSTAGDILNRRQRR